jgi:hypothetical protein
MQRQKPGVCGEEAENSIDILKAFNKKKKELSARVCLIELFLLA